MDNASKFESLNELEKEVRIYDMLNVSNPSQNMNLMALDCDIVHVIY